MHRDEVYHLIDRVRTQQNKKHPVFPLGEFKRLSILMEEIGELSQALNESDINDYAVTFERMVEELLDAVAVGVRWLEQIPSDRVNKIEHLR